VYEYARYNIIDDGLISFNGTYSANYEGFVMKFDSDGNSLWGQWIGGPNQVLISTIDIDGSGNIYVGGSAQNITGYGLISFNGNTTTYDDGFIVKFDSEGNSLWDYWITGPASDRIYSIVVDSSGNIYLGGYVAAEINDNTLISFNGNFTSSAEGYIIKFEPILGYLFIILNYFYFYLYNI
jgi:hypothetical protein